MKKVNLKYKRFIWEDKILQIPLDFMYLETDYLPYRRKTKYGPSRYESWSVTVSLAGVNTSFSINEEVYNEINEWIKILKVTNES